VFVSGPDDVHVIGEISAESALSLFHYNGVDWAPVRVDVSSVGAFAIWGARHKLFIPTLTVPGPGGDVVELLRGGC
jgi:hypothetical protein